ncbi:hypothetical protein U9M48_036868 [Paspalum notatum var. saurae]|uniref:Secreted protein n=1 Tax=Paspalum notatum var. saurae TaxID=547442 RepID=A0AAQ3XAH9_PASNO
MPPAALRLSLLPLTRAMVLSQAFAELLIGGTLPYASTPLMSSFGTPSWTDWCYLRLSNIISQAYAELNDEKQETWERV